MSSITYQVSEYSDEICIIAYKNRRVLKQLHIEHTNEVGSFLNTFCGEGADGGFDGIEITKKEVVAIMNKAKSLGVATKTSTVQY